VPFNYFERFVAYRYLVPLRKGGLLSLISWLSFIGICIGVATLIIVMSVMNGFHLELKNRIIGFNGHIFVQNYDNYFVHDKDLSHIQDIKFEDPVLTLQALISSDQNTNGAIVKSINSKNIENYPFIENSTKKNFLDNKSIILGSGLARTLGVSSGDKIKLLTANLISTPIGNIPKTDTFNVAGIFSSGMSEYDKNFAFIDLKNIQELLSIENKISTIEIHLHDLAELDKVKNQLNQIYTDNFYIRDWIEVNSSFWEVLATERELMFWVLSLIVIIAAFNVITSLFILVQNKSKEIAVLKTIGSSDLSILRIFLLVGSIIGVSGTIIGTIIGVLFTINIDAIRNLLNQTFNLNLFPAEFYYLDKMPTSIDIEQIVIIVLFALGVSIISTIYPAYKASKMEIRGILNNA